MVNKRIEKLREKMKEAGLSAYLVPTSDFHQSEYVGQMCIRDRRRALYL